MLESCDDKIHSVIEIYGCEWTEQKKNDPETKWFMENVYVKRPLSRLKPRSVCEYFLFKLLTSSHLNNYFRHWRKI